MLKAPAVLVLKSSNVPKADTLLPTTPTFSAPADCVYVTALWGSNAPETLIVPPSMLKTAPVPARI
jgi:hypothetical protein